MREKVSQYILTHQLMRAGDRVLVAVSGGADSVAILRVLIELRQELGIVLAVGHFNHCLRGEQSIADEAFVADLCKELALDYFSGSGDVRKHAATAKLSLEAAGRELRYQWLVAAAHEQRFNRIATGHTQNDQAETVLQKFLRGAGTRGLSGIYPTRVQPTGYNVRIVRPLLGVTRAEVEAYLASLAQSWREDESNLEHRFLRNRIRHQLLPLLQREYNPNLCEVLSELAELSRAEEEYWGTAVEEELRRRVRENVFDLDEFDALPVAFQRRVLKRFAENDGAALDFEHLENLRHCALGDSHKSELPAGRIAVRSKDVLKICAATQESARSYDCVLFLPGEVYIPELQALLRAIVIPAEFAQDSPSGCLLNRGLLGPQLLVRNWRPGDRFQPAHHRSKEKLKRLLTEKHVSADERPIWPVALHENEIVWVRGFPAASTHAWKGDGDAVQIQVLPAPAS